jgi:hypothetical protein
MLRRSLTVAILVFPLLCLGQSTTPESTSQDSTSRQQGTITTPPQPEQQPEPQAPTPQDEKKPSSGNKVTRKMSEALPDCVNLIFYHGCRSNAARQEKIDKNAQEKLSVATERCKQLTAALPEQFAAKYKNATPAETSGSYSSSKVTQALTPYCTPEDVIAADHDTEVGDFNFKDKNYRGAEMRYRSALERVPGEPIATLHLARALEKLGNKSEALDHYKTFLLWKPTGRDADEANTAIARLEKELALK